MGNQHLNNDVLYGLTLIQLDLLVFLDGGEDKEVSSNPCKGNALLALFLLDSHALHLSYAIFEVFEEVQWLKCVL